MVEGSTTIITGTLGAGKTTAACDVGLEQLERGGTVVTNIPWHVDKVREFLRDEDGLEFDPERLILVGRSSIADFQNFAVRGNDELPTLMLLDEAALDVSARDWSKHSDEQFNFVVLCRKLKIGLVLIAQDANDVDKRIRQKMQREIHCRSLGNFFSWLKLPVFLRVHYSLELGKKPWRRKVEWKWRARSWGLFDSHALHGSRAELFGALDVAKGGRLNRVAYPVWSVYLLITFAGLVGGIVSLCL